MRAIVTGGAGFFGLHVVEALLARGDDVLSSTTSQREARERARPARLVERDLRDGLGDVFAEARPEACFHLGAEARRPVSVERPRTTPP